MVVYISYWNKPDYSSCLSILCTGIIQSSLAACLF